MNREKLFIDLGGFTLDRKLTKRGRRLAKWCARV